MCVQYATLASLWLQPTIYLSQVCSIAVYPNGPIENYWIGLVRTNHQSWQLQSLVAFSFPLPPHTDATLGASECCHNGLSHYMGGFGHGLTVTMPQLGTDCWQLLVSFSAISEPLLCATLLAVKAALTSTASLCSKCTFARIRLHSLYMQKNTMMWSTSCYLAHCRSPQKHISLVLSLRVLTFQIIGWHSCTFPITTSNCIRGCRMAPLFPHEWYSVFAIRSAALEQWRNDSVGLRGRKDKLCEHWCITVAVWHIPAVEITAKL